MPGMFATVLNETQNTVLRRQEISLAWSLTVSYPPPQITRSKLPPPDALRVCRCRRPIQMPQPTLPKKPMLYIIACLTAKEFILGIFACKSFLTSMRLFTMEQLNKCMYA